MVTVIAVVVIAVVVIAVIMVTVVVIVIAVVMIVLCGTAITSVGTVVSGGTTGILTSVGDRQQHDQQSRNWE